MNQGKGKGRGRGRTLPREPQKLPPAINEIPGSAARHDVKLEEDIRTSKKWKPQNGEMMHVAPEALSMRLDKSVTLAKRPDYGTVGRKIALKVNYFPLELPRGDVYHYNVDISMKSSTSLKDTSKESQLSGRKFRCLNTRKNREIIDTMFRELYQFRSYLPAYDGRKNMYTRTPLKAAPLTVLVKLSDHLNNFGFLDKSGDTFEVSIKPVHKKGTKSNAISLDSIHAVFEGVSQEVPQEAIMAVETILRAGPCFRYIPVGRSFFCAPKCKEEVHPLSAGKEIWFGHHQSVILGQWKPMVNINVTSSVFHKGGPIINYVSEILDCSVDYLLQTEELKRTDVLRLSRKLKGLKIRTNHLGYKREYHILRVSADSANKLKFLVRGTEDGVQINIFDYFLQKYNVKLRYPHLPCLQMSPEHKKVYLPMELCEVLPGQHSNERMTEFQTAEMIKVASVSPERRFSRIQQVLEHVDFNNDPCNVEFGVRVCATPLHLEGRIISPPNVKYSDDNCIIPKDGSWEISRERFLRCGDVSSWIILSFVNSQICSRDALEAFSSLLCSIAQDHGINLGNPECIEIVYCCKVRHVLGNVKAEFEGVNLAVVVLPSKTSSLYAEIKQVAETELGILTQCVQALNVKKLNRTVTSNICQKINAKMGGINHTLKSSIGLPVFSQPVIVIGADVTHPPPGSGNYKPSIAAAVGSLDSHPSRYAVVCRAQSSTDGKKKALEIILDLKNMVIELLRAFYRKTNHLKPEKIIFYRDGVSVGQFGEVRDFELRAIRDACKSMDPDYEPAVTFIVVQKRHHTRFIPECLVDGVGKKRNIPPGTVVDQVACSPINFDFFLCSHYGLQGTSRPGHYTVVYDDSNFTSNELQNLSYYLCHIYARCTRSISLPAPVMYAHLAAYRSTKHLSAQFDEGSGSGELSGIERAVERTWSEVIEVTRQLKDSMYFV